MVPSGAEHDFTSNARGARLSYTTPLGGAYSYQYDDARRLKSVTSPSGSVVTNTYTHGFLTSVTAGDDSISLLRAICGRLDGTVRGSERSTVTYDGMIPVSEKRSGAVTSTLGWTYNTDFAPASFAYAETTQTYSYDADGLLTTATPFAIRRTPDSGLAATVTAPGFTLARTYSSYGEVDSADYGAYSYALTRAVAGRITGRTETISGATTTWGYTHDTLGRLTAVTRDGALAESYSYDEQGRRTSFRVPLRGIDTTQAAVFDAEDRVTTSGEATYAFTEDGFVASKASAEGTTTYTYTAFGELARVILPDGRHVTYTYDAGGRRTSKAIDGTVTERYLWADTTRLLATYDGEGVLTRRFLYADARTPYAMETPSGRRYLASDQVGSLRAVTDTSGAVTGTMSCDSFGNLVSASGEATGVGLGFAGGLTDSDTGLVLFGARDYDASQGRWMAKDPIGFSGGDVDLYGYCLGDPVGLVDPAGLTVSAGIGGQAGFLTLGGTAERSIAFDGSRFADFVTTGSMKQVPWPPAAFENLIRKKGGVAGEANGGVTAMWTSAGSVEQLKGTSYRAGASWSTGFLSYSFDFVWSEGCDSYFGFQGSIGPGIPTPPGGHIFEETSTYLPPVNRNINGATAPPSGQDSWGSQRSQDY